MYVKLLKTTGLYKIIHKNDFLFNIYVIPLRIRTVLKYKLSRGYPISYVWDLLSGRQLKNRKGECKMCGGCCYNCPELYNENGKMLCKIYTRREWCDIYFPMSPLDLERVKSDFKVAKCGFEFDVSSMPEKFNIRDLLQTEDFLVH